MINYSDSHRRYFLLDYINYCIKKISLLKIQFDRFNHFVINYSDSDELKYIRNREEYNTVLKKFY